MALQYPSENGDPKATTPTAKPKSQHRVQDAAASAPSVAEYGAMNFGLFSILARHQEFHHEWERPYLEGLRDRIFKNRRGSVQRRDAASRRRARPLCDAPA
jgi:uncharacterized protein (DUF849 family)